MDQDSAAAPLTDIYPRLEQLLTLVHRGNVALLSRPQDPVPRALRELLDFDPAVLDRLGAIEDTKGLLAFLQTEMAAFCDHLLLGELVYGSGLGPVVAGVFVPADSAAAEVVALHRAEVCAYVLEHTPRQRRVMEEFLRRRYPAEDRAEVEATRTRLAEDVAAVFGRLGHTLGAAGLPAPAPAVPVEGRGWSMTPIQGQLDMLGLTTVLLRTLPLLSQHPFAQGVLALTDYHPQRLEELTACLRAAVPGELLAFSRAEGLLLYQAAQVTLVSFLHDILDEGGLDDLLAARLQDHPELVADEALDTLRTTAAIALGSYLDNVNESEAGEAGFELRRGELARLLELAAG